MQLLVEETEDQLIWTRVLQFLLRQKEGRKSKVQGSCSFLSKEQPSKGVKVILH